MSKHLEASLTFFIIYYELFLMTLDWSVSASRAHPVAPAFFFTAYQGLGASLSLLYQLSKLWSHDSLSFFFNAKRNSPSAIAQMSSIQERVLSPVPSISCWWVHVALRLLLLSFSFQGCADSYLGVLFCCGAGSPHQYQVRVLLSLWAVVALNTLLLCPALSCSFCRFHPFQSC